MKIIIIITIITRQKNKFHPDFDIHSLSKFKLTRKEVPKLFITKCQVLIKSFGYRLCSTSGCREKQERVCVCVCARMCVTAKWHKEPITWEDPPDSTFTRVLCFPGVAQDSVYLPYAVTGPWVPRLAIFSVSLFSYISRCILHGQFPIYMTKQITLRDTVVFSRWRKQEQRSGFIFISYLPSTPNAMSGTQ